MHVDAAVEGLVGRLALHLVEELVAGKDAAGVARQRAKQLVLVGGEGLALAIHRHLAGGQVDHQAAALETRRLAGLGPPQHRADARQELARIEGLGEIVVGAQLQPDDLVGVVAARRHHDHRRAPALADLAREREAVHAGQHQVDQEDVEARSAQGLQRLGGIACHHRRHAVLPQELSEQRGELAVVFDEQRADHHSPGGPPKPCCMCFSRISFAFCASFCRCAGVSWSCTFWISGTITLARSWRSCAFWLASA